MRTLSLGVCVSLLLSTVHCSAEQSANDVNSPFPVSVIKYDGHRSVHASLALGKPAAVFAAFHPYVGFFADAPNLGSRAVQFKIGDAEMFATFMRGAAEGTMETSFQRLSDVILWLAASDHGASHTVDLETSFDSQINWASSSVTELVANDEDAVIDSLAMKLLLE